MAPTSTTPRIRSRASHLSTRSYHSTQNNAQSLELDSRSETTATELGVLDAQGIAVRRSRPSRQDEVDKNAAAFPMIRQDSGYESGPSASRKSSSRRRQGTPSKKSSSPSRSDGTKQRPGFRRTGASNPVSRVPGRSSLTINRPSFLTPQQQQNINRKNSYFQFPAPENLDQEDDQAVRASVDLAPVILKVNTANMSPESNEAPDASPKTSPALPSVSPPPTTHYWTSDRTRQLEYAAIDAASQGVRAWIVRNVVPDCLVPRNNRRSGFADDGGSVRRYRIELEVECPEDSVPPSPVGEQLKGFRARGVKRSWWAALRRCNA